MRLVQPYQKSFMAILQRLRQMLTLVSWRPDVPFGRRRRPKNAPLLTGGWLVVALAPQSRPPAGCAKEYWAGLLNCLAMCDLGNAVGHALYPTSGRRATPRLGRD